MAPDLHAGAPVKTSPRVGGFTLIELMVVIAIVAILMALALPSWRTYVDRGKRTDAKSQLLQAAQYMHRFYAANDSYSAARDGASIKTLIPDNLRKSPITGATLYTLDTDTSTFSPSELTLRFRPSATGSMSADPCGTLVLDHTGGKTVENNTTMTRADCWR